MAAQIIQLSIHPTKSRLRDMDTVAAFSARNGYDYLRITELPQKYLDSGLSIQCASNWLRAELLAETPYRAWIDWDIEITGDIVLGEEPVIGHLFEQFLYNGNNTGLFADVLAEMNRRKVAIGSNWIKDVMPVFDAFRHVNYDRSWVISSKGLYIHKWHTTKV